jgi:hypothetical protein
MPIRLCSLVLLAVTASTTQAGGNPSAFDPAQYGSDTALSAYIPSGIRGGEGTAFVTGWSAQTFHGITGRDLSAPPFPRVGPVKSLVGGAHCSFGQISPGGGAYLQGVGGSLGIDPANVVIAGVIDCAHGLDGVAADMTILEVGDGASLGLRVSDDRFLVLYGNQGSFKTTVRATAGPMAFILWSTPTGVRIECSGHPVNSRPSPIASSLDPIDNHSKFLFLGSTGLGGKAFKGGIRCLYFWTKQPADDKPGWTETEMHRALAALEADYSIQTPTELLIVAGDSYGAGFKLFGGESIGQWLAVQYPRKRVITLAQAGAVAEDPTGLIPDVSHSQLPRILDPLNSEGFTPAAKSVLIFDGHNETLQTHPSPAAYIASKQSYTAALQNAGFRVLWGDINPISNHGSDELVAANEIRREEYRAAIAASPSAAVRLTYCDALPALHPAGMQASQVRACTQGPYYYIPSESGPTGAETWAVGTYSDELHMGVNGWTAVFPFITVAIDRTQPVGACCQTALCSLTTADSCRLSNGSFRGLGTVCSPPGASSTCCPADFDRSSALTIADVFAFINAWLGGNLTADFDGGDGLQTTDIFEFLNAWFAGC